MSCPELEFQLQWRRLGVLVVYSLTGVPSCSRGTCRRRLRALTYPRDDSLRKNSCFRCFLNIAPLRVIWRQFHSLMLEILKDIQNDIFGDYRSSMRLKPAINTYMEVRNCFFMVVEKMVINK